MNNLPCPLGGLPPSTHAFLLQTLLQATTEPTWILDVQGRILAASAAAAAQYPQAAAPGAQLCALLPPFATPRGQAMLELAARTDTPQILEEVLEHSAVEFTVRRVAGVIPPLLVVRGKDFTAERTAQEQLRREQQRFQYLLEAMEGLVLLVGQDLTVRYCNRACRKLLGNIVGSYCTHVDCVQDAHDLLPFRLNVARPASWEWQHQDRHFYMTSAPMTDADGEIVSIIHGLDITRRKQAELQLAHSQQQLFAIVTYAQEGMVVLSDGNIVFANPFMVSLVGQPPETLTGQPFRPFIHPEDLPRVLDIHANRLAGRDVPFSYDCRLVHSGGGVKWVQVAATLLDWEGSPAVLAMLSDISDRKNMEQMLHDLLREQDRIIHEKTHSLVQANQSLRDSMEAQQRTARKLEIASHKAMEAARAKSLFLANMGHEIRTPLNVILGMTQVALRDMPVEGSARASRRPLEMIRESGAQLLTIINDLLDFSKIEAHRLSLENIPLDLPQLLRHTVESFAPAAAAKGLQLTLNIHPDVPEVVAGDPARMAQVLNNLLSNALKFTAAGSVTLRARLSGHARRKRPGPRNRRNPMHRAVHLLCCVEDTGPGIPKDKADFIFKRFQQVDDSIARRYGGTGLGLTISRRLARLMGGDVWVRSMEGKGSRFYFSARLDALEACMLRQDHFQPHRQPGDQPLTLLLAEDSPQNAEMLCALLAPYGHRIVHVSNGQLALDALRQPSAHGVDAFDLVLMDVQMPVLDGLTATRLLRAGQDPALPRDIPVIALTAHSMAQEVQEILRAGATRHVAKPVDVRVLVQTLAEVTRTNAVAGPTQPMEQAHATDAPPAPETPPPPAAADWQPDRAAALARLGGSEALLARLTAVFAEQAPSMVQASSAAWEAEDLATVALHAHTVKGNASAIGATPLADAAAALEAAARQGSVQDIPALLRQLEEAMAQGEQALHAPQQSGDQ